jgi:hypothetical protein
MTKITTSSFFLNSNITLKEKTWGITSNLKGGSPTMLQTQFFKNTKFLFDSYLQYLKHLIQHYYLVIFDITQQKLQMLVEWNQQSLALLAERKHNLAVGINTAIGMDLYVLTQTTFKKYSRGPQLKFTFYFFYFFLSLSFLFYFRDRLFFKRK